MSNSWVIILIEKCIQQRQNDTNKIEWGYNFILLTMTSIKLWSEKRLLYYSEPIV